MTWHIPDQSVDTVAGIAFVAVRDHNRKLALTRAKHDPEQMRFVR